MTLQELLDSKKTFYTKRIQSNGFYPIDKYEWDETEGAYRCWAYKKKNWGCNTNQNLYFVLKNNPYLITAEELFNEHHSTYEGKEEVKA